MFSISINMKMQIDQEVISFHGEPQTLLWLLSLLW